MTGEPTTFRLVADMREALEETDRAVQAVRLAMDGLHGDDFESVGMHYLGECLQEHVGALFTRFEALTDRVDPRKQTGDAP